MPKSRDFGIEKRAGISGFRDPELIPYVLLMAVCSQRDKIFNKGFNRFE